MPQINSVLYRSPWFRDILRTVNSNPTYSDLKLFGYPSTDNLERVYRQQNAGFFDEPSGNDWFTPLSDEEYQAIMDDSKSTILKQVDLWDLNEKKPEKQKTKFNWNIVGYAAPAALDFIGSAYNGFRYDKTASDLSADYGYGRSQALGVGYTTQNIADARQVMKEEHSGNVTNTLNTIGKGAALGSVLGPWGAAAGAAVGGVLGLFGGGSRHAQARRELALQQLQAIRTNNYNRSLAMTTGMQLDFAKKYGNQESLVLFAKHGIDAIVDPNEVIVTPDGNARKPIGGTPGKDSVKVNLSKNTAVLTDSNVDPETGKTFSELAQIPMMVQQHVYDLINKNKGNNNTIAKNAAKKILNLTKSELLAIADKQHNARMAGYLPPEGTTKAANGIDNWGNVVQTLAGIGTALGGFFLAKNSKVHRPDIRVANPYEGRAIADLYSLRPDNLSIIRGLRDAEARGRYQIASAGGLGAGQRALANVALTANTLNSIANALAQSQDRFNALRSLAATTALNTGNATAQRNMAALQYNDAAYQQAASARQNVMRDYLAQIPGMLGQYYKNWYTQQMGNNMLNLYQQGNGLELMKYMNDSQRQKILNEMGYA